MIVEVGVPSPSRRFDTIARISLACAILLTPQLSQAQEAVRGGVRSVDGAPLPNAIVSVWRGGREIARTASDSSGTFRLNVPDKHAAMSLLVRRIGYRPTSMPFDSLVDKLIVELTPNVTTLPMQVVTATRGACSRADDPDARKFWRAVADRYASHSSTDAIRAVMSWRLGEVDESDVGIVDESRLPPGEYAVAGSARAAAYARLQRDGYARALNGSERETVLPMGEYFYWQYAPLHRDLSEHFVQAAFAELNTLSEAHASDGSATIWFCGRDRRRPYVEGTLSISRDSSILSAQWRFHTPTHDENAGGEVVFLAPERQAEPWTLIPARSAFWRRVAGHKSLFFDEASVYREWHIGAGIWP